MKKAELIAAVAEQAGLSKADATKALAALTDVVTEALVAGDTVQLTGLGTFSTVDKPAREYPVPGKDTKKLVEAHTAPKFKLASPIKAAVKGA